MFLFNNINLKPKEILTTLEDFEAFCLGEKKLTPDEFRNLNIDLSINAVLHVGRHKFRQRDDGRHLIWMAPDKREHDLGPIEHMNVMRDYPGFNKLCTLSLGNDEVLESRVVNVPLTRKQLTIVKMKDGSSAVGPDYKTALRNAVLKMRLKKHFNAHNARDIWARFYGNA